MLLHGWPVTQAHWRELLQPLRAAGFTPVPISLPGLGVTPAGTQVFRKTELVGQLREELSSRGLTRFAVIGHDWGTPCGLSYLPRPYI